jgi:hypothetical protein
LLETIRASMPTRAPREAGVAGASGELERLARLRSDGVLDDTEFAAAKAQVLGLPVASSSR